MPRITVVIPVLGRHDVLRRTLVRLGDQRDLSPGDLDVVLVPDRAEPDPDGVAAAATEAPVPTSLAHAERPGASAARNAGWRAASAPLILFLGADILAAPRLVAEHLAEHDRFPGDEVAVLGRIDWADHLRPTPFMRWLDDAIQFDYGSIDGDEASWSQLYSSNVSLKRALLERVGGFDEVRFPFLYEDLDLGLRLTEHGLRVRYRPAALGGHDHAPTLDEWRGRAARIAEAERTWVSVHPEQPAWFHGRFAEAAALPPARGRGRHLALLVPRGFPGLGPYVWRSVDLHYRQALAPAFLEAWERAGQEAPASSAGSPPGGPK